jgi:Putative methyltransferase.
VAAAAQEYSIHKFPGFQIIPRQIIPRPADCSSCDKKNKEGEKEEHCDYDLVRYEIPFPVDIPINRNDDTRSASTVAADRVSFPTGIVIQTLEPTSQQDKKIRKKMNVEKELMSHVYYGVDNTGNTRVWDCSNVLAFVILQEGNQEQDDEKKKRTSILVVGQNERQLENLGNEPLFGNLMFSNKKPLIGLKNILSLATVRKIRRPRLEEEGEDDNSNSKCRKILRVLELGAGMAALPSLALAVLGKHFKKWNEEQQQQQQQCGTQQSLKQYPDIHVTITDGHPRAVAKNVACIQRTMGRDDNNDGDADADNSIQCCPLLWKRNEQGRKECQELTRRARSMWNDVTKDGRYDDEQHSQQQDDDGFDLILVSDCLHFTDFHVDLAMTIGRLLRVGGVCLLCQPARGTSLERFLHLIHCINGNEGHCEEEETTTMTNSMRKETQQPLFQVDLHYQYHPTVTCTRNMYG